VPYRAPDFVALGLDQVPNCKFEPAPADFTLPDGFLSTTNFPTYVKVNGEWRLPEMPRMDSHLVWSPSTNRLDVREFRLIRKGDLVAVAMAEDGSEGVFVWDRGFAGEEDLTTDEAFGFMTSEVSREKPVNYDSILNLFMENRGSNGSILWVIGPALVHSRAREAMEWMIHHGFVHALLTGNAVGVHDVEAGRIQGGIMHALTVTRTPYVLAGSIRDDGPLPETIADNLEAQARMREHTSRATMAVLVATALHSIAVGNMLPTFCTAPDGSLREIPTICVDQTEFLVSKLKDRGTHQAFGVVTNAQDFLRLLHLELERRVQTRA